MAQTEMMLRLLLKGKIVGKMLIRKGVHYSLTHIFPTEDMLSGLEIVDLMDEIEYDSFELGIKVDNDWWFEGDIIECTTISDEEDPGEEKFNIPIEYNGSCFFLGNLELRVQLNRIESYKRIGNIHDKVNSNAD